jgi:redox-sensitive bicupin YhaK (pirin superfamily)
VIQDIPAGYNAFIYVLDGEITAGTRRLTAGQVGWLDDGDGPLTIGAGPVGARSILHAGERQGVPLVMHGPFVGESRADLLRLSRDYLEGRLPKVSEL